MKTAQLAMLFRVTEKTVHDWARAAMPCVTQGRKGRGYSAEYELPAVVEWYFARNFERLELDRARTRLANEQADKARLDNDVRRSDLAEISLIAAVVDDLVSNVKTNLLALPRKIAPELEGMNVHQREEALDRRIRGSLEQLSSYRAKRHKNKVTG